MFEFLILMFLLMWVLTRGLKRSWCNESEGQEGAMYLLAKCN